MRSILNPRYLYGALNERGRKLAEWHGWDYKVWQALAVGIAVILFGLCISIPLDTTWQALFSALLFCAALYLRRYTGTLITLVLTLLSVCVSTRYLYWRITNTVDLHSPLDFAFGVLLVGAEIYAWTVLLLGYMQTAWPLKRKPVPLPTDLSQWPTVDVYIPTYNEPLSVVKTTVFAAMALDWPPEKLNIYILDDNRRDEFRKFAQAVGVTHLTRPNNLHAKAGNINAALEKTSGEFIAIFDCDHMPTRSFLQSTMGWFLRDPKLGVLQTPHHFMSPDPFERNLNTFREIPSEGELFYGLVQDGNDLWNATFFCGSCAVLRRSILLEIGGIAVETVTEDAHTALKMQRLGYNTAYIAIPQAAGLATESLSSHVGQRIRWARGMGQIARVDNPLFGKGLTLGQRLCYANAILHFFYGLPRMVFLLAPLSYLFFEAHVINASALGIAAYALPHLLHANLTNSRIQGKYRHSFWAEVYEATLAWYIFRPTLVALINPKLGSFNVTAKGGLVENEHFDWIISKPYLVMLSLNILGLVIGIIRLLWWNTQEIDTVVLNLFWTTYNLIILGATLAVATERKQVRKAHRVKAQLKSTLRLPSGHTVACHTEDYSSGGLALRLPMPGSIEKDTLVGVSLYGGHREYVFPAKVIYAANTSVRLELQNLTLQQEMNFVRCTVSRADVWVDWSKNRELDHPINGFKEIFMHSVSGFIQLSRNGLSRLRQRGATLKEGTYTGLPKIHRNKVRQAKHNSVMAIMATVGLFLIYQSNSQAANATAPIITPSAQRTYIVSLKQLGALQPIEVRGVEGEVSLPFTVRSNEVITSARLKFNYAYSPAMLSDLSHLKVMVNDELISTIALPREKADGQSKEVVIDPRIFSDFNHLKFKLIGHYTRECEDPLHSTLWAKISNASVLELTVSALPQQNDLSLLPAPFFDTRDNTRLVLPFVVGNSSSLEMLKNAGVVASWFGSLASYRGARFPVSQGKMPDTNAIVLATPEEMPPGLDLAEITGPSIAMVNNPLNPYAKLLVIAGRNTNELHTAVLALTLGQVALSGPKVRVNEIKSISPRKPYDAPNWLPTDRPIRFGELAHTTDMQVRGLTPDLIRVNFRVAPDLFPWMSQGTPVNLKYRYTQRPIADKSTLNININNRFIRAIPLHAASEQVNPRLATALSYVSFLDNHNDYESASFLIPPYWVSAQSQLQFHYFFDRNKEGACKDVLLNNTEATVEPDSTIDFSDMPHYAAMPNLGIFADAGYPFTRMADLSETAIVMPENPAASELEAYFLLMGRMGEATGYPATNVTLIRAPSVHSHADKDLIVIGASGNQPLLREWEKYMLLADSNGHTKIQIPSPYQRLLARWAGQDLNLVERQIGELTTTNSPALASLTQFQSPLAKERTVVVITSRNPDNLPNLLAGTLEPDLRSKYQGSLVLVKENQIQGFALGDTYYVGSLPLWTFIRWKLSDQPLALVAFVLLGSVLASIILFRTLRQKAAARLKE